MSNQSIKHIFFLLLVVYTAKAQLSECLSVEQWERQGNFVIKDNFNFSDFRVRNLRTVHNYNLLGKGGFGMVYNVRIKPFGYKNSINAALKVIRYEMSMVPKLNNELMILQSITKQHPYSLLNYYNCVNDLSNNYNTLFLFTELLEGDLNSIAFRESFVKTDMYGKLVIFNLMARAVKAIHYEGYGHFDIKPENFMYKKGKAVVIKLIDYGLVSPPVGKRFRGSANYMDPHMKIANDYVLTRKSDIFSLGISFHDLLYTLSPIAITSKRVFNNHTLYLNHANNIMPKLINFYASKERRDGNPDLVKLHTLIKGMVTAEINKRPLIDEVIEKLEEMIRGINPNSMFLTENYWMYDEAQKQKDFHDKDVFDNSKVEYEEQRARSKSFRLKTWFKDKIPFFNNDEEDGAAAAEITPEMQEKLNAIETQLNNEEINVLGQTYDMEMVIEDTDPATVTNTNLNQLIQVDYFNDARLTGQLKII